MYRILQRKEVGWSLTTSFVAIITLATMQYKKILGSLFPCVQENSKQCTGGYQN